MKKILEYVFTQTNSQSHPRGHQGLDMTKVYYFTSMAQSSISGKTSTRVFNSRGKRLFHLLKCMCASHHSSAASNNCTLQGCTVEVANILAYKSFENTKQQKNQFAHVVQVLELLIMGQSRYGPLQMLEIQNQKQQRTMRSTFFFQTTHILHSTDNTCYKRNLS